MNFNLLVINFVFFIDSISASLVPRIVGGDDVDINEYPYQASIRIQGDHICGGTIISNRHILTVAHCITNYHQIVPPYDQVSVNTGTGSSITTGQSHSIDKIIIHPKWRGDEDISLANDVAIIKLTNKIEFNEQQQKIKLANSKVVSDIQAVLTGWGHTSARNGRNSIQLQKITMTLLSREDCQPYHQIKIHRKQFCAFHSPGHGACFGDSGGPLMSNNRVIGITTWISGEGCASGTAEIFTNVYAHKDFIINAMNL